ncbi:DUF4843 domain-containing protein [Bacteroides eggerthii]|uniref:DUF4843 domain-containing protein n=1 Tax=Bacteroides eggerthii TaxID=28111 RepID=A0ABT7U5B1_9BACE|nr:DUF4843 domain-containing protein [Bacteroides eggerthii]
MKTKKYIPMLLLGVGLTACEHQEPFLFDAQNNGIYFNEVSSGFQKIVNFSERVLDENCTDTTILVSIRVLGHLSDAERTFTMQMDTLEGITSPEVTFPSQFVIPAGAHEIDFPVTIKRPAVMDSTFAFKLLLNQENGSDFGAGIAGQNQLNVYVTESYQKSGAWLSQYFGDWSAEKQIFLCRLAGNANLEEVLSNPQTDRNNLSVMAVDSIRNFYATHPGETLPYSMPFCYKSGKYEELVPYTQPSYWGEEQTKWVGPYNAYIFASVNNEAGINTANEQQLWNNIDETKGNSYNKRAVETMLSVYNTASTKTPRIPVTERFGIPIIEGVAYSYQNCLPSIWNKAQGLLAPYYGKYENPMLPKGRKKYTFMLNALYQAKKDSDPNFCLYLMFPIIQNAQGTYILSDEAFEGTEYATATEALRDFNRIFREADVNNEYGFPAGDEIE